MIKALVFDFDGLILDTETVEFRAWQELYISHDARLEWSQWILGVGTQDGFDPYGELERQLGFVVDRTAIRSTVRERVQDLVVEQEPLPGVEQYLRDARKEGLKLGVATSSGKGWAEGHLERLGLAHYFEVVRSRDDVVRVKPDPDLYVSVLEVLGVEPPEAIAFEDSLHGVRAAKAAGVFCVAVPNEVTRRLPLEEADLLLDSLTALSLNELLAGL